MRRFVFLAWGDGGDGMDAKDERESNSHEAASERPHALSHLGTSVPGSTKYLLSYRALPVSTKTAPGATNYQPGSAGGTTDFVLDSIFAAWYTP